MHEREFPRHDKLSLLPTLTRTRQHATPDACLQSCAGTSACRTRTRERGSAFQGWVIHTDGGTRVVNGDTSAGWGAIARSLNGRIVIIFGPVVTSEAHLAFSGARTHSNNTAEMIAMVEELSFLGLRGPVARDSNSCIFYDSGRAAGVCLSTIQARTHVQLALVCQQVMLGVQYRLRLTMQHVHGHTGNLGNECVDHAPLSGHSASCLVITLLRVGLAITSIPLLVSVPKTTLVKSWKLCNIRTETASLPCDGSSCCVFHRAL